MGQTVLTSGVHSEYVLGALSSYLRHQGINVIELDFGVVKDDVKNKLHQLAADRLVYITSAHTNFSVRVAQQLAPIFAESYPNYLCPLEIMPLLGSNFKSVYVPHDLLTPYGDTNLQEFRFLNIFDHILAPGNAEALKATIGGRTEVHEVGWIKFNSETRRTTRPPEASDLKVAVFITMLEHLRLMFGQQGLIDYVKPIMKDGYSIKLPTWHGVEAVENAMQNAGIHVVPAEVSSIELIDQSDVVICNGASSIHAEASYMGKPTICLLGEEGISSVGQRQKLSAFPEIIFMSHEQLGSLNESQLKIIAGGKGSRSPKVFDFSYVANVIRDLFDSDL